MTILSDRTIREICLSRDMIEPFCERTVFEGKSYGLSCAGYDVRIAETIFLEPNGRSSFKLASTMERFRMPNNVIGRVCDKSTWARLGLAVQNTILECGWEGYLTLELSNNSQYQIIINSGSPIAQITFEFLDRPAERPYNGKYNNQPSGPQPAILEK